MLSRFRNDDFRVTEAYLDLFLGANEFRYLLDISNYNSSNLTLTLPGGIPCN